MAQGFDPLLTQAQSLGTALFTSPEHVNGSNTDFVTDLYWAYLQRAPDQGGLDFWVYQLTYNGASREAIRGEFARNRERYRSRFCIECRSEVEVSQTKPVPRNWLILNQPSPLC